MEIKIIRGWFACAHTPRLFHLPHPLSRSLHNVFRERMRSSKKTDNVPKVTELAKIRRNSVSPLPTARPFSLPRRIFSRPGIFWRMKARLGNAKATPNKTPGHLAALSTPANGPDPQHGGRRPPARGVWGPLRRPAMPACAPQAAREPAALPATLRVPGRLTEPRARGGATRDWPRGVGGGPAAGRPGGRRQ